MRGLLKSLDLLLEEISSFCIRHRSTSTVIFLGIYGFLQLLLPILLYTFRNAQDSSLVVALWSTILLLIIAIDKVIMDKRTDYYKEHMQFQIGTDEMISAFKSNEENLSRLSKLLREITARASSEELIDRRVSEDLQTKGIYTLKEKRIGGTPR